MRPDDRSNFQRATMLCIWWWRWLAALKRGTVIWRVPSLTLGHRSTVHRGRRYGRFTWICRIMDGEFHFIISFSLCRFVTEHGPAFFFCSAGRKRCTCTCTWQLRLWLLSIKFVFFLIVLFFGGRKSLYSFFCIHIGICLVVEIHKSHRQLYSRENHTNVVCKWNEN